MMKKKAELLWTIEQALCYFSLICLAFIPAAEAFLRVFFHSRFPASPGLIAHLLLVLGLLSGMNTTKNGEHLSIGLVQYFHNEKIKDRIIAGTGLLSTFIVTIFAWCSVSFIKIGLSPWQIIGFIPDQIFALVMPIGYGVMVFRFARMTPLKGKLRLLSVLAILLGTLCSLPVIFKLIWSFDLPDFAYTINEGFANLALSLRAPVFILLILAALAGTPLFVVIGGLALILIQSSWGEIDVVSNQVYTALTQNNMVAIPLFTLAGFILSESRAGERLVHTFQSLFGWLPGGLIIATVIICAFFTSFTGASGVTILALGGILHTVLSGSPGSPLEKGKYSSQFSIGLLTASGSIGLLFPPSLAIFLVGATTRTNTIHLFLGGLIPGLILVLATVIFGIVISVKTKIPVEPFSLKKAGRALKNSLLEILLPFLLIIGYFSGILSLVEIGAAAAIYLFVAEVFVYRDIELAGIVQVFKKAIPIIGGILSILALSQALSYYIVDTQAPYYFAQWMEKAITSKYVFLLVLNLALLVVGCLVDIFSAILIVLPLIMPLGEVYGIAPVHLGIIFLINMEAGFITPPVGLNLFLASYRFRKPFLETSRNVMPFLIIQLAVVFIVTYFPLLTTYLTRLY
ncbi:trap dicarboxylate transporter, dctm subunit [Treponema primitia ZAS-2]|uniref:Trap dicarboxylate transporter, dctm subunit n=1 Tax=Treponema primitia (strain ATCC BAA-887 / DSM 12427 / ZAS-2) TaxID=545694 RepID=F5YIN7_TREPZ|nr:TRAP transporter large permease subunit [Treponema primitia]AEF86764.1 trap dicarboxylate transporter, dctm subunit [Treponema primitia ZAS-2]